MERDQIYWVTKITADLKNFTVKFNVKKLLNPAFHFDFPKASQCSFHIRITLISILRYLHSWWWLQVRSNVPQPELILPLYDKVENQRGAQYWELRQPDSPNQKVKILAFFCWHYSNSYFSLSPGFSQKIKTD